MTRNEEGVRANPNQAHRARLNPLPLLLVPQRHQPHHDGKPPRDCASRSGVRWTFPGDLVIDIGCNDGTLLDGYSADEIPYLGYDPSDVSRYAVEKGYDVVNDFFCAGPFKERYADRKAKSSRRSRCSTTSSVRAISWPTWRPFWPSTAYGSWSCTICRSCSR